MAEERCERENGKSRSAKNHGQGILVLPATYGKCSKADWQDKNDHDQMKGRFVQQGDVENREDGQQQRQRQAVKHTHAREQNRDPVEELAFLIVNLAGHNAATYSTNGLPSL